MEKQKGVKRVSIFSAEGRNTLTQLAQVREEAKVDGVLDQHHLYSHRKTEGEETRTSVPGDMHCHSCNVTFAGREEQVEHYRLDWHRHNLKRRLKGLSVLSQDDFESQSGMGDLSSISGSESESSDDEDNETGTAGAAGIRVEGSPLLVFSTPDGTHHAIYKCLVVSPKDSRITCMSEVDLSLPLSNLASVPPRVWIVLMRSGGHFAGAVFRGSTVVSHKTFHRYTVRAKQGTVQSSRDSHSGGHKPKSAGASLRRYNEAALEQEISDLVLSWRQYVDEASLIFIRAPKHRRLMFTSGKDTLINSDDPRIRSIPFMTRRPTFSELKTVVSKLSTIHMGVQYPQTHTKTKSHTTKLDNSTKGPSVNESFIDKVNNWNVCSSSSPDSGEDEGDKVKRKKKQKNKKSPTAPLEDEADPVIKNLHELITTGDEGGVQQLLSDCGARLITVDQSNDSDHFPTASTIDINKLYKGLTALHVAATGGYGNIVYTLLSHGADPMIKDSSNRVPYLLCKDRSTRDSFRRFKGHHPSAYNYSPSLIPCPLTEEMEEVRREKKSEKKKAQKKAQKQKKKEKAAVEELNNLEKERDNAVKGLSEREKRALAAERRLASSLPPGAIDVSKYGVCSWCKSSLCGVVAFERLTYKYCGIDCVKEHRKELQRTN